MTEFKILRTAVKLERQVAAIYYRFNDLFKDDLLLGHVWHSLATEEEAHADFIEAEIKMSEKVPDVFGDTTIEMGDLQESLKKLAEIERSITNETTLKEAIKIAIDIERDLVERQYDSIIEVVSPGLKKIFKELTSNSDHLEKLNIAARKLGII
ncbi:MAG: hypothetical protein KAR06_08795 [Deltaproteobacteria bacterium]|nr:hypothetical protein [Deltaproteobacteria bacterium]